ncbi:MAG TPA: SDR family oxidoreductase [Candidatus Ozemobacteraceae bacterium]|nr:SDR family oxidoreductase [Candidatus Ozemobacteraceae bacterium]
MIAIDFSGKSALITGGTRGIGLATALDFGRAGAKTYLTYKWGQDDYGELFAAFEKAGAPKPVLLQADVSVDEDTTRLMGEIAATTDGIDYFISNVGFAQRTMKLDDYKKRSLFKTLEYSTWPLIGYSQAIKKRFGRYPRHIVGISSDGPSHFYRGYDFVAASKALLEHFAKYMSIHLFDDGCRVNVIRFGSVKTESFSAIFGEAFFDFLKKSGIPEDMMVTPEECGRSVLALCSGFMDAVNGQIITVDKGMPFRDNLMMRYQESLGEQDA